MKSISRSVAALVLIANAWFLGAPRCLAQSGDEASVRMTVAQFLAAYRRGDADSLASLCTGTPDRLTTLKEELTREMKENAGYGGASAAITRVTIEGDTALVRLVIDFAPVRSETKEASARESTLRRSLRLVKDGNSWRVADYLATEKEVAEAIAAAADDGQRKKVLDDNSAFVSMTLVRALIEQGQSLVNHGDYDRATAVFGSASRLAEQLGAAASPQAVDAWLGQGDAEYFLGDYEPANADYGNALAIARRIGYQHGIAFALKDEGNVRQVQGDWDGALGFYEKSLEVSQAAGDKEGMARVLSNMGLMYDKKRDDEKALQYYQRSLELSKEIGRQDGVARTLVGIAMVYEWRQDFLQAISFHKQAMKIFEELGDREGIVVASNRIASSLGYLGDHAGALKYLRQTLEIARKIGEKSAIAAALEGLGRQEYSLGRYRQVLAYYEQAMDIYAKLGDKHGVSMVNLEIGNLYAVEGNRSETLKLYKRALSVLEAEQDKVGMLVALEDLADFYINANDYTEAEGYAQRSLKLSIEVNDPGDEAFGYITLGRVEMGKGVQSQSLDYGRKALAMFERNHDLEGVAFAQLLIGDVYYTLEKDYAKAAAEYDRAVAAEGDRITLDMLRSALTAEGRAYRRLNQADKARKAFTGAIAAIEEMRKGTLGRPQLEEHFLEGKVEPYSEMVGLLVDDHKIYEALAFSERAKARTLVDVLASGNVDLTKAMSPEEKAKEQQLRSRFESLNIQVVSQRISKHPDEKRLAGLQAELAGARSDLDAFEDRLYAAHPDLGVQRADFKPATDRQIGQLIDDPATALLEYEFQGDAAYLFVLTKKSMAQKFPVVTAHPISSQDLADLIEQFRGLVASRNMGYQKAGSRLYDLLIEPAARELAGKKNLIIVPDGALWALPFQALQSAKGRFLIEDFSISYAPSLTALLEMNRTEKSKDEQGGTRTLLAMGNPEIGGDQRKAVGERYRDETLTPLPEAERQVEALGKMYGSGSEIDVGGRATESRFKELAGKYRIVELATHALIDDASPMYSQIVLARSEGSQDDGVLEAWEIMNLNLRADMVVLSACETGLGRVRSGEGMIGLSWAVFVAGCPTTVVSQWKVESASTTELMIDFHKELLAGKSKTEALRNAELSMLKNPKYRNPFYWAPFVIVGRSD